MRGKASTIRGRRLAGERGELKRESQGGDQGGIKELMLVKKRRRMNPIALGGGTNVLWQADRSHVEDFKKGSKSRQGVTRKKNKKKKKKKKDFLGTPRLHRRH